MLIKKIFKFILILSMLNAFQIFAHTNDSKNKHQDVDSESLVELVVDKFQQALNSGNKEMVLALLMKDVKILEGGKVERSAAEYASHHLEADMKYLKSVLVKVIERQVKIYGEVAVSSSRIRFEAKDLKPNSDRIGLETIILKKINGDWKIAHIHWS